MQRASRVILVFCMFVVIFVIFKSTRLTIQTNQSFEIDFLSTYPSQNEKIIQQTIQGQFKSPVAFAISISSCTDKKGEPNVLDGAAVLGWSIRKHSKKYGYHLYAFVHNDTAQEECVQDLKTVGYDVISVNLPFSIEDLQADTQQYITDGSSCCGAKEFLKLYAYTLTDHKLVVHLDVDTLLLQPMDDLLDYLLLDSKNFSIPMIASQATNDSPLHTETKGTDVDFVYTREYKTPNLIDPFNKSKYGIQGGFFVVRPNVTWYHEMLTLLKSSNYNRQSGWGLAGYGGYWGSAQVQGFLSWVYPEHYYDRSRLVELNPCIYNTLAMNFSHFSDKHCHQSPILCGKCRTVHCLDCQTTPMSRIKIMHFSTCLKPWTCPRQQHYSRIKCKDLHPIWYRYRQELELAMGVDLPPNTTRTWKYGRTFGYCLGTGEFRNKYVMMNVTNAQRPLLPYPTIPMEVQAIK